MIISLSPLATLLKSPSKDLARPQDIATIGLDNLGHGDCSPEEPLKLWTSVGPLDSSVAMLQCTGITLASQIAGPGVLGCFDMIHSTSR